jgi:hypothetical protein
VRRVLAVCAITAACWIALATPASAIETATFGITAGGQANASAVHATMHAGSTEPITVEVWNRTAAQLTLDVRAVPATVDSAGSASLGGKDEAAGWASFAKGAQRPILRPKARTRITVSVDVPKHASHGRHTFAVLAEPVQNPGEAPPAVLQRLAVMAYVQVDGPVHATGPVGAASVALLVLGLAGGVALTATATLLARHLRRTRHAGRVVIA